MFTNEKAKQNFLQHLPVPLRHVVESFEVVISRFNFVYWKHMRMQISYKPVFQACQVQESFTTKL